VKILVRGQEFSVAHISRSELSRIF